jgi:hypothetical protein
MTTASLRRRKIGRYGKSSLPICVALMTALCGPFAARAANIDCVQSGPFDAAATWANGVIPGPNDTFRINSSRTVQLTNTATVGNFSLGTTVAGGSLNIAGGSLTTTNDCHIGFGFSAGVTISGNGTLNMNRALRLGSRSGCTGELTVQAGTANIGGGFVLGSQGTTNSVAVVSLGNNASVTVASGQRTYFSGSLGSVAKMFINHGAVFTTPFIDFQASNNGPSSDKRVVVNGGTLRLTLANKSGTLVFSDPVARVQFDTGRMIFTEVGSTAAFNTLKSTFDAWVDQGKIISSVLSPAQLKSALTLSGADAVVEASFPGVETVVYLSPSGNDHWSGALAEPSADGSDGPLATLKGARDRLRVLRAGNRPTPFSVVVRGGTYYESPTLVLEVTDSGTATHPVVFKNYPGEKPVFSGGRRLPQMTAAPDGSFSVSVPTAANRQWMFRQLFVDDVRYTLARSPNSGYFYVQGIPPAATSPYYGEPYWQSHNFIFRPGDLKAWSTLTNNDVNLRVYNLWEVATLILTSVDETAGTAFSATHMPYGFHPNATVTGGGVSKRYIVENAPDALDAPGEWYLDRASGVLRVIPFASENLATKTIVAPVNMQALVVEGDPDSNRFVEHIRFEGLAFRHYATPPLSTGLSGGWRSNQGATAMPACIQMSGVRNITLLRCEIANIGTHAVELARGCRDNRIEQCHLHDLGGGGIYIGERVRMDQGYDPGLYGSTGGNTIHNNFIHDGGVLHEGAVGIMLGQTSDNIVSHNEVAHFNWSGMQIGWNWDTQPTHSKNNTVEYNYIHDIGQNVSSDLAGIYTVGENLNTTVRHNVIRDVFSWLAHLGRGIYPDQETSGIVFSGNLVYHVGAEGLGINFCRDITVQDNIFALNAGSAPFGMGNDQKTNQSLSVSRNIFYYYYGNAYSASDRMSTARFALCNSNLYWRTDGQPVTFMKPGSTKATNRVSFNQWKLESGLDSNSGVADPMFVDPERGDFRFKNAANAQAIGFAGGAWTNAGLIGDPAWTNLPDSFDRPTTYDAYKEKLPGFDFSVDASEVLRSSEFAFINFGTNSFGGLKIKALGVLPDTGTYSVWSTSDLRGTWQRMTNVEASADGIMRTLTFRDSVPVRDYSSRFYRVLPVP